MITVHAITTFVVGFLIVFCLAIWRSVVRTRHVDGGESNVFLRRPHRTKGLFDSIKLEVMRPIRSSLKAVVLVSLVRRSVRRCCWYFTTRIHVNVLAADWMPVAGWHFMRTQV